MGGCWLAGWVFGWDTVTVIFVLHKLYLIWQDEDEENDEETTKLNEKKTKDRKETVKKSGKKNVKETKSSKT